MEPPLSAVEKVDQATVRKIFPRAAISDRLSCIMSDIQYQNWLS
jgi:hypothetical protein